MYPEVSGPTSSKPQVTLHLNKFRQQEVKLLWYSGHLPVLGTLTGCKSCALFNSRLGHLGIISTTCMVSRKICIQIVGDVEPFAPQVDAYTISFFPFFFRSPPDCPTP